jgi:hypothetical protein
MIDTDSSNHAEAIAKNYILKVFASLFFTLEQLA